jgi:hypothetical protein
VVWRIDDDGARRFLALVPHFSPHESRVHAAVVPLLIHAWINVRVSITSVVISVVVPLRRLPEPLLRASARWRRTIAEYGLEKPSGGIGRLLRLLRDHHRLIRIEGRGRHRLGRRNIR